MLSLTGLQRVRASLNDFKCYFQWAMMSAHGEKRKRSTSKFYSVRLGHKPGVYTTWPDCLKQVKGFKGAYYKSFASLTDAEKFLDGEDPDDGSRRGVIKMQKYYAVRNGRVPGIYTDWPSAQQQVVGWTKPRHKCFATRAEAERFLKEDSSSTTVSSKQGTNSSGATVKGIESPSKRMRTTDGSLETYRLRTSHESINVPSSDNLESLPLGAEDGFDNSIVLDSLSGQVLKKSGLQSRATKLIASQAKSEAVITVYTDGSSLGNGQDGASAGVGVYFGPGDPKNISEPLHGQRQTNQRAELTAILRALEVLPKDRNIEVVTDSKYAIRCITDWSSNWQSKGWRTSTGKPVENRDLIETALQRMEQRSKHGARTSYRWTKGHAADEGNKQADKLAVEGARIGAELSTAFDSGPF